MKATLNSELIQKPLQLVTTKHDTIIPEESASFQVLIELVRLSESSNLHKRAGEKKE